MNFQKTSSIIVCLSLIIISIFGIKGYTQNSYKVYPVLLVHGFTGNFYGWVEDGNVPGILSPYYDLYSDRNARYRSKGWFPYNRLSLDYNVFGISYTDTCGPIENNAEELNRAINGYIGQDGIRQIMSKAYPEVFPTPDDVKIIIIAHSMGGLSTRYYLQTNPNVHSIIKLITLGTPHKGSFAADKSHVLEIRNNVTYIAAAFVATGSALLVFCPWASAGFFLGAWALGIKAVEIDDQIKSGRLDTSGAKQMIPNSNFLNNLNYTLPVPANIDYRLVAGLGWWTNEWWNCLLGVLGGETTEGDGVVCRKSAIASNWQSSSVNILKDSPHYTWTVSHTKEISDRFGGVSYFHKFPDLFRIIEDPPVISNVALFTSDSKPLPNNTLQDITKPGIIITGNLWDYLLHKLDAKLVFSNQIAQQIDFDTFGYFSETATLAAGGKNTVFVMANNPANYYSASNPHNIYLVGIVYPRDGMVLTPEGSAEFQYEAKDVGGNILPTEPQHLSFGDYGGVLPEKIIDLPANAYRLSPPRYLNGETNPDITFLDENGNLLEPDESGNYKIEGMTRFKAKLNNDYQGKTFVKLQGNADANNWEWPAG